MARIAPKTWIEISRSALRANARALSAASSRNTGLMAVVKSNAYGHGLREVVKTLGARDCAWFGVDSLREAIGVRDTGSKKPVLILGYTPRTNARLVVSRGFSQVAYSRPMIDALSRAGSKRRPAKVHLKIETGTSRQGIAQKDLGAFLRYVKRYPSIKIEGISTHFANIEDTTDPSYAMRQLRRFEDALIICRSYGIEPEQIHAACSAAVILYPQTHFTLVRTGIALYGLWPSECAKSTADALGRRVTLRPALTWKTIVAQVKKLEKGTPVSYGLTERVRRDSVVAVLPIGYWDGFDRALSSVGEVLIRGKRAKVLGRVCMNMVVVDVTDIPGVRIEDEVVILGVQESDAITAEEVAKRLDTINYEVVTRINPTLPRILV